MSLATNRCGLQCTVFLLLPGSLATLTNCFLFVPCQEHPSKLPDAFCCCRKMSSSYLLLTATQQPQTDEEKLDLWVVKACEAANLNLGPFFLKWHWPVSSAVLATAATFPALPADWDAALQVRVCAVCARELPVCMRLSQYINWFC